MYFPKVALLQTTRNSLLTSLSGLQPTGCNATKSELITRFLKDVYDNKMKIPENFQEEFCDVVFFKQHRKPQPSFSHDFRNLGNSWDNVCGGVSFCRNGHEKVLWRIVVLNSFLETSHEDQYVYLKRTPPWMFYRQISKNFWSSCFFETGADECFQKF